RCFVGREAGYNVHLRSCSCSPEEFGCRCRFDVPVHTSEHLRVSLERKDVTRGSRGARSGWTEHVSIDVKPLPAALHAAQPDMKRVAVTRFEVAGNERAGKSKVRAHRCFCACRGA